MQGAFHGRTMGAMALTSSKTFYKSGFAPLMPQTFIAPYPYCLHCKARQAAPDGKDWYKVHTYSPLIDHCNQQILCYLLHHQTGIGLFLFLLQFPRPSFDEG